MTTKRLKNIKLSLTDLLGKEYTNSVCRAKAFIENTDIKKFYDIANTKVDFYPESFAQRINDLLPFVGKKVCNNIEHYFSGAGTKAFNKALNSNMAPLAAIGFIRIGENGKAYLIAKSEHYHTPLGHSFPGYQLIEKAKKLGIPNATHNTTRGYITRLLETELVRIANGIEKGNSTALQNIINSANSETLNRVINLETGSLAVEAGIKMMLTRFYKLDPTFPQPEYFGKTPVFLVLADFNKGKEANYHGTTVLAQMLRGLWPDFYSTLEKNNILKVVPVKINDVKDFENKVNLFNNGNYKIAGFLHEIVLMNYGAIKLTKDYLQKVYEMCKQTDIPILADEIQSCLWSPQLFMFKEYGLKPDFVSVGKGFPGGEYPASKLLTTPKMDSLNLFGALVTNGQEELASLAYLITMAFVENNQQYIEETGNYYEESVRNLKNTFNDIITNVEGSRHMTSIFFNSHQQTIEFVKYLNDRCIDVSAQTYKPQFPPVALTKIPIISTYEMIDFIIDNMIEALKMIQKKSY